MVRNAPARQRILDAALSVIRARGYAGTTVDDLCEAAGVTKGAFFHHFESKEDLAVAAVEYWSQITGDLFARADYHQLSDPLDRIFAYVEFRKTLLRGSVPEFTCLAGTLVQETYESCPTIRQACQRSIFGHAETLVKDIELAKKLYAPRAKWSARGVALHTQAVLQGAFILAKAQEDAGIAAESIDHLHRYLEFLFNRKNN